MVRTWMLLTMEGGVNDRNFYERKSVPQIIHTNIIKRKSLIVWLDWIGPPLKNQINILFGYRGMTLENFYPGQLHTSRGIVINDYTRTQSRKTASVQ